MIVFLSARTEFACSTPGHAWFRGQHQHVTIPGSVDISDRSVQVKGVYPPPGVTADRLFGSFSAFHGEGQRAVS